MPCSSRAPFYTLPILLKSFGQQSTTGLATLQQLREALEASEHRRALARAPGEVRRPG